MDDDALRAAVKAHCEDAHNKGEKCFSRRRVIAIADLAGIKPMSMVWRMEKLRLLKRGSYEWFKCNGGITYDDIIQCRVDRDAERALSSGQRT